MPIVQPGDIVAMGSSNLVLTANWAPVGVPYIILSGSSINHFDAVDSSFTTDTFLDGLSIDGVYQFPSRGQGYIIPASLTGDLNNFYNAVTLTLAYDGKYIQFGISGGGNGFSSDTYAVSNDPMSNLNGISIQLTATGAPAPADCTWAGGTSFIGWRADSILPTATFYGW